jgi:hypothetical protein
MDVSNSPLDPLLIRTFGLQTLLEGQFDFDSIQAHAAGDLTNDLSWLDRQRREGFINLADEPLWHAALLNRHRSAWGAYAVV